MSHHKGHIRPLLMRTCVPRVSDMIILATMLKWRADECPPCSKKESMSVLSSGEQMNVCLCDKKQGSISMASCLDRCDRNKLCVITMTIAYWKETLSVETWL
jgi:hypothetical protein